MSSRKVKKGVGTQRRAEVSAIALGNGDSTSPSSSLGVPRPSAMPPHASSSSPPGAPQPPSAPPQASFPNSARGLWPGFDNGAGQYSHGNQSTNPWGFPQGGFVNFINQNQFPEPPSTSENFHLVGLTQSFSPFCPPPTPYPKGTPTAPPPPAAPNVVNLDTEADVVEESRTTKKSRTARHWTPDEEKRLASAWLNTSKDPIYGNDKSRDTFWGQISNEFNKNIQEHLKRDINQLKIHWGRLHKSMTEFNGFFSKVSKINTSGYSDDMLIDEAHQMWQKKYGKRFTLEHWWKKLKNEPKWTASIAQ
ncbi:hypothetical protein E2562_037896 [Oryza meyeriana var. granulata]|uniref:Myb-like domain-containing protein n=1 Tax=Oryza meyeriana var. granulata TaxID=110450 RepID=A0A6G1E8J2_9ORYZ|nr:hypothetical protein E2562_037896 [Oryza meyeriana var. granulata]